MLVLATDVVPLGLLARAPLLESIRKALTSGPRSDETTIFVVGLIAFVLLVLLAARFFGREERRAPKPRDYLTLSVDVLGLSETERRDLQTTARRAGIEQPASMLLSPANLAHAALAARAVENDSALHERLGQLSVKLFDAPLPKLD